MNDAINSVMDRFITMPFPKENLRYKYNEKIYEISAVNYVWILYQILDDLGIVAPRKYPSLMELLFYLNEPTNFTQSHCTGRITLDTNTGQIETDSQGNITTDEEFGKFIQTYLQRLKSGCRFNSLALDLVLGKDKYGNTEGHQNILFSYMTKDENILLSLYDPGGARIDPWHGKVNIFLMKIRDVAKIRGYNIEIISRRNISCPLGMQYKDSTLGFCIIYSFFWLYCVLQVMDVPDQLSREDFIFQIGNVERIILERREDVSTVIVKFAHYLVDEYMTLLKETTRADLVKHLERLFIERVIENINDLYPVELVKTERKRSHGNIKRKIADTEIYERSGQDGSFCTERSDCLSDLCVENRCVEHSDYFGTSDCKEDSDCLSRDCENGKCKPYRGMKKIKTYQRISLP